ncbi:IclR family transcriptional regulator [Amycolatopsis viridis]|uniref:IclR family acetate operon transcriptional repressor n=1 Tax=Amycolatopsis viridis TaxID=185678 RepID=A0ABX0SVT4_9PSEU|nr:IclR family transcriptional regulator [Amycolatopsis viridis]NIH79769.1 IclR family acetate operon transcriptional repressor [Amycolatopsis viridis]
MADLARVTLVLDTLAESRHGLTVTELAVRTGLPRSTVHRVLQCLERELYVVRAHEPDQSGYVLGPALLKFGMNSHLRLLAATRPDLVALARELHERVELAVFSGREVVVVDQIAAPARLRGVTQVGKSFSLHASCIGKALLARLPDARVTELLPPRLDRFTPATITDRDVLLTELVAVRRTGVAVDLEEHDQGISAVATTRPGPGGTWQAVAVVMPSHAFAAKFAAVVRGLQRVNAEIDVAAALDLRRACLLSREPGRTGSAGPATPAP